jgi:hypothetical protein
VAATGATEAGLSNIGSPAAENEIVGAIGAFSAPAEARRSGPSPGAGGRDGGDDTAPESRFGLGGGASLRDSGGVESCVPGTCAVSTTPLAVSTRAALSLAESDEPDEGASAGGSTGSVTPTSAVSSEFSIVIQLSTAIHRSAPCPAGDRHSAPARARPPRSNPGETCRFRPREPRSSGASPGAARARPKAGRAGR